LAYSVFKYVVGFDDGYFPASYKARRGKTIVAGVCLLNNTFITSVTYGYVTIDGRETENNIIQQLKLHPRIDLVLLDGVTYSGFDVVDPDRIHDATGYPVITIQAYPVNLENIKLALMKHFDDWRDRFEVIERVVSKYRYLPTNWKIIQYYAVGLSDEYIPRVINTLTIYSPIPEPLRIAHHFASSIARKMHERALL